MEERNRYLWHIGTGVHQRGLNSRRRITHVNTVRARVWRSEKIEKVLDFILKEVDGWSSLVDKYISYPDGEMDMRMLVLEKHE